MSNAQLQFGRTRQRGMVAEGLALGLGDFGPKYILIFLRSRPPKLVFQSVCIISRAGSKKNHTHSLKNIEELPKNRAPDIRSSERLEAHTVSTIYRLKQHHEGACVKQSSDCEQKTPGRFTKPPVHAMKN